MVNDMTVGKPLKNILMMSLPIMAGNLFQQFYGMADAIIVGRYLGSGPLAAVGATSSLYYLILWFATGVTSGFVVLISQFFGAGDYKQMRKKLCLAVSLTGIITLIMTTFSVVYVKKLLIVMNTPEEILTDAFRYIVIILLGLAATMVYNLSAAVLRALGDSRTPLYFLVLTSVMNIVLDLVFIRVLKLGTAGAALATVISQACSGLLCTVYMYRHFEILHICRDDWKHFRRPETVQMLKLGLPLGIQGAITASGVIVLQIAVNSYGADGIAAFTAANKVEQLVSQILAAYSVTIVNYVGQNYGAKKIDNIRTGVRDCLFLVLVTAALGGVLLYCFGGFAAGWFLDVPNPRVLEYAREYLSRSALFLWAFGMLCMYRSSIQGMGDPRGPLLNGVIESVSRILWTAYLIKWGTFHQLCFANPATWTLAAAVLVIFYRCKMKKLAVSYDPGSKTSEQG